MKKYNETDQIIKDRLEHFDSGVPMHLFDGIEEGLASKKKRGGFWWWSAGMLLLLLIGTSWYLVSNSSPENETNIASKENANNTLTSLKTNHQLNEQEGSAINTLTTEKEIATQNLTSNKASVAKTQKVIEIQEATYNLSTEKVDYLVSNNINSVSYTHLTLPTICSV